VLEQVVLVGVGLAKVERVGRDGDGVDALVFRSIVAAAQ
jgi:hypothetical protein